MVRKVYREPLFVFRVVHVERLFDFVIALKHDFVVLKHKRYGERAFRKICHCIIFICQNDAYRKDDHARLRGRIGEHISFDRRADSRSDLICERESVVFGCSDRDFGHKRLTAVIPMIIGDRPRNVFKFRNRRRVDDRDGNIERCNRFILERDSNRNRVLTVCRGFKFHPVCGKSRSLHGRGIRVSRNHEPFGKNDRHDRCIILIFQVDRNRLVEKVSTR